MSFHVVIPARFASARLPGKPLLDIAGKPMVVHVWERAKAAGADEVVVATDDAHILEAVRAAGGDAQMTRPDHPSGTDRLAEVAAARGWAEDAIVVNLQGDEPLMPEALPGRLARALADHPAAGIATMAVAITDVADVFRPSVVKVVRDADGLALYFSRAPIPYARDAFADGAPATLPEGVPYLRHLGLYGYRVGTLARLAATPPSPLERAESLEQLRALSLGIRIHVGVEPEAPPHGVDTPEDLERVRALFARAAR